MRNRNTRTFWNQKIVETKRHLLKSPIYLDKNNIVTNFLYSLNGNLLNVGVGYGSLEKFLVDRRTKLNLFGIDISDEAIRKANKFVKGKFFVASVLRLPFENKFFDFVTALDVLEHLRAEELVVALNEIKRVLKDGGVLIVSVPLNESEVDRKTNRHEVSFTKPDAVKLLEGNGFEVKKVTLLYAFRNSYLIKTLITRVFRLKQPNLIIMFCRKK